MESVHDKRVPIFIIATSHKEDASVESTSQWSVRILLQGSTARENVPLSDPLSEAESAEVQWFLEVYPTASPFEISRAAEAKELIESYGERLASQLDLETIITAFSHEREERGQQGCFSFVISVLDDTLDPVTSVHSLHWECIEALPIWAENAIEVTICRRSTLQSGPNDSLTGPGRIETLPLCRVIDAARSATFNILLVIARDLRQGRSTEDVEPFMTLRALISIKKQLRLQKSPVRLGIHVVRPGTYEALSEHLDSVTRREGPGYYHLIHFDVHGVVAVDKRRRSIGDQAYLRFSSSRSPERLQNKAAKDVAGLVKSHSIGIAVLNACRTAVGDRGLAANLAAVFVTEGVPFTLAMSYALLGSTASLLLRTLYHSFLVERHTLIASVSRCRTVLQKQPERMARFGRSVTLLDWIVPVAYISGQDFQLSSDGMAPERTPASDILAEDPDTPLLGRDIDCMRLEQRLAANRVTVVAGHAGVGKSALLEYCSELWRESGFAEAIIALRFEVQPLAHLYGQVKSKLEHEVGAVQSCEVIAPSTLMVKPDSTDVLQASLVDLLDSTSVVLWLDDVDAAFFSDSVSVRSDTDLQAFIGFLTKFEHPIAHAGSSSRTSRIILSGRKSLDWWQHRFAGALENCAYYNVEGLELRPSVDLAVSCLDDTCSRTLTVDERQEADLRLCVELLQNSPEAIRLVFEQLDPNAHLHDALLHSILHVDLAIGFDATRRKMPALLKELISFRDAFPDLRSVSSYVSLFWTEGPYVNSSKRDLKERYGLDLERTEDHSDLWHSWEKFTVDHGMIESDGVRLTWIHPLCTIFWRATMKLDAQENATNPTNHLQEEFSNQVALVHAMPDLTAAAQGWDAGQEFAKAKRGFFNCLSALDLCLDAGGSCPFLENVCPLACSYLETAHLFLSDGEFHELGKRCEKLEPLLVDPCPEQRIMDRSLREEFHHYLLYILTTIAALLEFPFSPFEANGPGFGTRAVRAVEEFEARYGPCQHPSTLFLKAKAYRAYAMEQGRSGNENGFQSAVDIARNCEKDVFDQGSMINVNFRKAEHNNPAALYRTITKSGSAQMVHRDMLTAPMIPIDDEALRLRYSLLLPSLSDFQSHIFSNAPGEHGESGFESVPLPIWQRLDEYNTHAQRICAERGISGLPQAKVAELLTRYRKPENILNDLEDAELIGNWRLAASLYNKMARYAAAHDNFDDALEYQRQSIRYLRIYGAPDDELQEALSFEAKLIHHVEWIDLQIRAQRYEDGGSWEKASGAWEKVLGHEVASTCTEAELECFRLHKRNAAIQQAALGRGQDLPNLSVGVSQAARGRALRVSSSMSREDRDCTMRLQNEYSQLLVQGRERMAEGRTEEALESWTALHSLCLDHPELQDYIEEIYLQVLELRFELAAQQQEPLACISLLHQIIDHECASRRVDGLIEQELEFRREVAAWNEKLLKAESAHDGRQTCFCLSTLELLASTASSPDFHDVGNADFCQSLLERVRQLRLLFIKSYGADCFDFLGAGRLYAAVVHGRVVATLQAQQAAAIADGLTQPDEEDLPEEMAVWARFTSHVERDLMAEVRNISSQERLSQS